MKRRWQLPREGRPPSPPSPKPVSVGPSLPYPAPDPGAKGQALTLDLDLSDARMETREGERRAGAGRWEACPECGRAPRKTKLGK